MENIKKLKESELKNICGGCPSSIADLVSQYETKKLPDVIVPCPIKA